ncbi:Transketolase [Lignipirellula cremea]|uniref:Transketolase n=2 Tax=Lignipirellula cremea TaxID=2528010 RepID=A0A518DLR2_9BACT|nr:transketolase [Lignipirellula cremea]QDU92765.1 Transketolase [Lignipirellula cremea]
MSVGVKGIEQLAINTIRTLSMDAVQKAKSGHPGTPMALAPVAYALWNKVLSYDPAAPLWPARDRFVLSCGHASMLLYSLLHVAGVKAVDKKGNVLDELSITLDNIRNFRQLHSPCAGHPEFGHAAGIETTTGPLGQGCGNSVGMALAAKWFSAKYDRPGYDLFGHNVYVLCSDGDLMEGVSCEAASLAGHLKLSNLCWIYDNNHITIEGETDLAFNEDVAARFRGLGWSTIELGDANDLEALQQAFDQFDATDDKPTIIVLRSIIGYGSPNKANSHSAHGAPLGEAEIKLTKEAYGWPEDAQFLVPEEVLTHFAEGVGKRGAENRQNWEARFAEYKKEFAAEAAQLQAIWSGQLPAGWDAGLQQFPADEKGMATRVSSGKVLNMLAPNLPWLMGGSADLAPSTMTLLDDEEDFGPDNYSARNMHFGIREHGMASAMNGMSLSGLRPYGATFFVFTDYMRPPMRLASIMGQHVLYVLTHDSIGLGEDGPTHQPVEQLAACRAIPGMVVFRPGDANEVLEAYRTALQLSGRPTMMVLTRQNVPTLDRSKYGSVEGVSRGGYTLIDSEGEPQVILLGTGSETPICLQAYEKLTAAGVKTRVVSMPSCELFDEQDEAYRHSVLPPAVTARVAVEAGIKMGWERYLGEKGKFIGMSSFGASAPFDELYAYFGITPDHVVAAAKACL